MTDPIVIKLLALSDIHPEMLEAFNHRQVISQKWVKNRERYELTETNEVREWSKEKKIWISQYLCQQISRGGAAVGAFSNSKIIAFACLDGILKGKSEKYANLTMLFVDDEWKRKGIGKRLFRQICLCGQNIGADKIFISAIPSYETVLFYFGMGCSDTQYIIDDFIDTENDRYLEYDLKRPEHDIGKMP